MFPECSLNGTDLAVVLLEGGADGLLEVVDEHKVREERQDVLDL